MTKTQPPASEESRAPSTDRPQLEPVAFRFHPRALAALGRDLVTNDVVAVMELVKNAYDALASRVDVRIRNAPEDGGPPRIEVVDDGQGMDSPSATSGALSRRRSAAGSPCRGPVHGRAR